VLRPRSCAIGSRPTPSGPEGSSGKRPVYETQSTWEELKGIFSFSVADFGHRFRSRIRRTGSEQRVCPMK
jgi:hypothetical protein